MKGIGKQQRKVLNILIQNAAFKIDSMPTFEAVDIDLLNP